MKKNVYFVCIVLFALVATSCKTMKKSRTDDDFYDFDKENTNSKKDKNDAPYDVTEDGAYAEATDVSSRPEKVEIVRGAIDYDAKYFIILGSFSQEENANKLVGKLAKQGFAPNVLRSPSGMYRVSGYYFNDERAARMEVTAIRAKYPEYDDLWLLIKK